LTAPLSGQLMPIDQVPDPVFAQKMVGDGVSIDPVSQVLVAPCDGQVVQLHSAGHAVTVAAASGVEVMMHIGLDTVKLAGQGFTPRVRVGDRVRTGDTLIEFDADFVGTHARSLLTQLVVTNGERVTSMTPHTGPVLAGRDPVLDLVLPDEGPVDHRGTEQAIVSDAVVISLATGLHARPAAVIAATAKRFHADLRLRRGGADANAKSVVAIMGLEVNQGDAVTVVASGSDAGEAIRTLTHLLRDGLGDEGLVAVQPGPVTAADVALAAPVRPRAGDPNVLAGVAASPGTAVGNVFQIRHERIDVREQADDPHGERKRLDAALQQAQMQLASLQARLQAEADAGKAAIFGAHIELLEDPDLVEMAERAIAQGKSAGFAWHQAVSMHADRLARMPNALLAARANDLRDVGRRVLRLLAGTSAERPDPPANAILVAEDLSPSDTASLDRSKVLGFCTTGGGATSHVAILARSLDIPAVAAIDPRALGLPDGMPVILDGTKGVLRLNPSVEDVASIHRVQERHGARRRADLAAASAPAITTDGRRLEVAANIGGAGDAEQVVALGGEGVGLLRSEFLFLDRSTAPSEDEQYDAYRAVARALGPDRPLVIRTLDVGGDKPLPYLPMPVEANPFLGERGIRLMLNRPDLLRAQLRAILRASTSGRVLVMFPMIATVPEWRTAKAMLEEEREKLGLPPVPVGIMVEVPSAAISAERFAREVDFFSIGTNDLTQYTLAMDRGHPKLAPKVDGLHPAVLHLIAMTVAAAHGHGRWVGVCGGLAGDPQGVPLLVGLGVDELSVSVPAIPAVKAQIRSVSAAECRELAARALTCDRAADVRDLVPAGE
jgi:phosphoenolpyruvate-protein phosphotransferase